MALAALRSRVVPGMATLGDAALHCEGLNLSRETRVPRSDLALVLSRGFGGTNAACVLRAAAA